MAGPATRPTPAGVVAVLLVALPVLASALACPGRSVAETWTRRRARVTMLEPPSSVPAVANTRTSASTTGNAQERRGVGGGEIVITYCTRCNWMLRSAWLAQELLSTFGTGDGSPASVASVALAPDASGGVFTVHCNGEKIWDRREEDPSFPEAKVLKQRVRDVLCPNRDLGHSDVKAAIT